MDISLNFLGIAPPNVERKEVNVGQQTICHHPIMPLDKIVTDW